MKKAIILGMCLLLGGAVLTMAQGNPAQSNDDFEAFWQKFKAAVVKGDKETVVGLSSFPIRMPGRVRNIKDAADLRLRYREVFNKRVNAARCFPRDDSTPVPDDADPHKEYGVSCFDGGGDNIVYVFARTKTGWKFVRMFQYALQD
jgi:hypothetical protein